MITIKSYNKNDDIKIMEIITYQQAIDKYLSV